MSQRQLVWSGKEIQLATALSSSEMMASVAQLNMSSKDFEMHHYRGFTSLSALDRADSDYSIMAKQGVFQTPVEFMKHKSFDGGAVTEFVEASHVSREVAPEQFTGFVDRFHDSVSDDKFGQHI